MRTGDRWPIVAACLACALGLLSAGRLYGHGDLHERIEALSARIEASGKDAELFYERSLLYLQHGDAAAARGDIDRARSLGYDGPGLDLALARCCELSGDAGSALRILGQHLGRSPADVAALAMRARLLDAAGRHADAAADSREIIRRAAKVSPELYSNLIGELAACGEHEEALRVAEEGLRRLGPLLVLQEIAVDLNLKAGRNDAALSELDRLIASSARKEMWLARKADVLLALHRPGEALVSCRSALAAMDALPPRQGSVPAVQALRTRVEKIALLAQQQGDVR